MKLWIVFVVYVILCLGIVNLAHAHDWYDYDCCDEDDCRPAREGEVILQPDGWYVNSSKQLFPFEHSHVRDSQDGKFHVCQYRLNQRPWGSKLYTRCVYVLPMSW